MDNWFVCLKHGNKYSAEYVNTLYNMFRRNAPSDIRFACYTEDRQGLNSNIEVFSLPIVNKVHGWWYKPFFFNPLLPTQGVILYCDLDVVIFRNIEKFYTMHQGKFCILRDFTRATRPNWPRFNSSIFRVNTGDHSYLYNNFVREPELHIKKYHGDQDYIYNEVIQSNQPFHLYPDRWAESYKWEMRKGAKIERIKGTRNFVNQGEPHIHLDTSVAVFHGEPNPQQCIDPWVVDNWR